MRPTVVSVAVNGQAVLKVEVDEMVNHVDAVAQVACVTFINTGEVGHGGVSFRVETVRIILTCSAITSTNGA